MPATTIRTHTPNNCNQSTFINDYISFSASKLFAAITRTFTRKHTHTRAAYTRRNKHLNAMWNATYACCAKPKPFDQSQTLSHTVFFAFAHNRLRCLCLTMPHIISACICPRALTPFPSPPAIRRYLFVCCVCVFVFV